MKKNIKETYNFLKESVTNNISGATADKLTEKSDWELAKSILADANDAFERRGKYSNISIDDSIDISGGLYQKAWNIITSLASKDDIIKAIIEIDNLPYFEWKAPLMNEICEHH